MLPLELSEKLTSNKVIVVEDMESAPGRGYILAKALFNIQNERTSGAEVFTEISPFQTSTFDSLPTEFHKHSRSDSLTTSMVLPQFKAMIWSQLSCED